MKGQPRGSILKKLGLTEEDVRDSERLFQQMPPPPPTQNNARCLKEERLLGYAMLRLKRAKALKVLGASEEDVDTENAKNLGSLGRSGRRRSFVVENMAANRRMTYLGFGMPQRRKSHTRRGSKMHHSFRSIGKHRKTSLRRKSTGDLHSLKLSSAEVTILPKDEFMNLKKQNQDANDEIMRLKQRLENLEKDLGLRNNPKGVVDV
mmetsp:Transcript_3552/g.5147  ORF Transcript_3552/g.5147 Transcript_3552/m.5147 type:complete len:206 (+) Transcript_3552:931-1548(+)